MEPLNFVVANEDCNLYSFDMRKLDAAFCVHEVPPPPTGAPSAETTTGFPMHTPVLQVLSCICVYVPHTSRGCRPRAVECH